MDKIVLYWLNLVIIKKFILTMKTNKPNNKTKILKFEPA